MHEGSPRILTRRTFLKATAALTAALGSCGPGAAADATQGTLPPESEREVEARFQLILARRGNRLTDEERVEIRRILAAQQRGLERFREYPLSASDQPAPLFRVHRKKV